jgi:hypothetical protein
MAFFSILIVTEVLTAGAAAAFHVGRCTPQGEIPGRFGVDAFALWRNHRSDSQAWLAASAPVTQRAFVKGEKNAASV